LLGLPLAHTVHDILPHDWPAEEEKLCGRIYRTSDFLVVHSQQVRQELSARFPGTDNKILVSPHGVYTMFARQPGARSRMREQLKISEGQRALLFFGGVRPYKNIDAVLEALGTGAFPDVVLIVCGTEYKYPDVVPGDPLGRTRKQAERLGIESQVRLMPRRTNLKETAELFEAADILVLPYVKTYGSGVLLLGMTFGKYIVATPVGGIQEYLQDYPQSSLLRGPDVRHLQNGLKEAISRVSQDGAVTGPRLERLRWPNIARNILREFELRL
jgi:glycosyltransferase involved in cell wall biosynthesis